MLRMARQIQAFATAGAKEISHGLARNTASARGVAPGAPVGTFPTTSRRPGELRGSHRLTVNRESRERSPQRSFYPVIGADEVEQAYDAFTLGDTMFHTFIAPHANIIEGGRRRDRNGRWIGSLQAPEGFLHLARDQTLAEMDRWRWNGVL